MAQQKNRGTHTVNAVTDAGYVRLHLQLCKPYVNPIEIGADIANEEQRDNAPGDFPVCRFR